MLSGALLRYQIYDLNQIANYVIVEERYQQTIFRNTLTLPFWKLPSVFSVERYIKISYIGKLMGFTQ